MNKEQKAYKEIFDVINKYKDIIVFDCNELDFVSKKHLFTIELKEKYGLNIELSDIYSLSYNNIDNYKGIGWWGKKYNRTISFLDDGIQPVDELLLSICFSSGAYLFGDDYPIELFQKFWQELKSYNPKYIDTTNHNLFFSMKNAKKIFNEFNGILDKYHKINEKDMKKRKIEKLQNQLKELSD